MPLILVAALIALFPSGVSADDLPPADAGTPVRERSYTIYGYNDDATTVEFTDPELSAFLDGSGIAALREDEIELGPGGGALAAFSRAYGERFNGFQRANANRRSERLWKSQYFGAQDLAAGLAAKLAGRTLAQATEELFNIRPASNLVIVDPRTTDVPAGILVHGGVCVRADGTLDSSYPPFGPDQCVGGKRIDALGVYTHVFIPDHADWKRRLEMQPIRTMVRIVEADGSRRVETAPTFQALADKFGPVAL